MKRQPRRALLFITLSLLLLFSSLVFWQARRQWQQACLDHALIVAIQHYDAPGALTALRHGANALTRDVPLDSRPIWRKFLDPLLGRSTSPVWEPSALLLLLQEKIKDTDFDTAPFFPKVAAALLADGADVDEVDHAGFDLEGQRPLGLALHIEDLDLIGVLVKYGAEVNTQDQDGLTALILSLEGGDEPLFQSVLQRGAKINTRDGSGDTALIEAGEWGEPNPIRMLLAHGAEVNAQTDEGKTTLMWVAYWGESDLIRLLIRYGARVNVHDKDGQNALMWAANGGCTNAIRTLLDAGADIEAQDKAGRTALMDAIDTGQVENVKLLLEHHASVGHRDHDGLTAIQLARSESAPFETPDPEYDQILRLLNQVSPTR